MFPLIFIIIFFLAIFTAQLSIFANVQSMINLFSILFISNVFSKNLESTKKRKITVLIVITYAAKLNWKSVSLVNALFVVFLDEKSSLSLF